MKAGFTEVQRFRQWWILAPLLFFTAWLGAGLFGQLSGGDPFGTNPLSDQGAIILLAGWFVFLYFFLFYLELRTEVDEKGIRVRLRGLSSEHFLWDDMRHTELITYRFVGYGLRLLTRYGTVYNMRGKRGLVIALKNGRRYLIGTQKPDALRACLKSLNIPVADPDPPSNTK